MKKHLPNYVFKKKYDFFYIFSDSEVILNDFFSKKLEFFLNENKSGEIIFEIELPFQQESFPSKKVIRIKNPNKVTINEFYEKEFEINGDRLVLCLFDYFMHDNSNLWEGYVSSNNDICIIGCNNEINSLFEVIFAPYQEENLEQKYKGIGGILENEKSKKEFIESLEKNYHFSDNG